MEYHQADNHNNTTNSTATAIQPLVADNHNNTTNSTATAIQPKAHHKYTTTCTTIVCNVYIRQYNLRNTSIVYEHCNTNKYCTILLTQLKYRIPQHKYHQCSHAFLIHCSNIEANNTILQPCSRYNTIGTHLASPQHRLWIQNRGYRTSVKPNLQHSLHFRTRPQYSGTLLEQSIMYCGDKKTAF